jgi:fatty-acyl-CoA synthase
VIDMQRFRGPIDIASIEAVPIEVRVPYRSVYEMMCAVARRDPAAPAVLWLPKGRAADDVVTVDYGRFVDRVTRTANLLHGLGVRDGAAVSILLPNCPEMYYATWGGSAAGVANPVNPLLTAAQIAEIMAAAGSRVLVTGGPGMSYDVYEKAKAVRALYPALETLVVVGADTGEGIHYDAAVEEQPGDRLISGREFREDDPSVFFHTGGTPGAPKLAQQTHRNQLVMAWSGTFLFALSPADRVLTGLPLFHANAAISTGLTTFYAGAAVLLCGEQGYRNKAMMADFWPIVSRFRATVFSGVPTIYASLLDQLPPSLDVTSLRFAICGAAPMPVSLFREFEARTGVRILEAYGMTEGGAMSTINPRDGERRIGSIGVCMPYQQVRPSILDEDGNFVRDCETDEVGVLLLRGPNLFPGYRQAQHNRRIWPMPGWFNSGDLGRRDADGYYFLAGRAKDLIIRGGHNIDPAVIEEVLHRHPGVELASAVGKPDAYAGEVPIAYVRLAGGASPSTDELLAFARETIPERAATPVEIVIVKEIPVTAVGMIFKPALRLDAVRRAYATALAEMNVEVRTRLDDKRGIVAEIICPADPRLDEDIQKRLGRFPIPFDIVHVASEAAS